MPTQSSKNPFSYLSIRRPMATPITHLGSFLPNINEEQRQLVLQMNKVVEKIDFHHISGVLLIDLDQIFSLLFKYTSRVESKCKSSTHGTRRESVDNSKHKFHLSNLYFTRNSTSFYDNIQGADRIIFGSLIFLLKKLFFVEKKILILCTQYTSFPKEDFFQFLHHNHELRSFFELFQRRVLISRSNELALNYFRQFATTVLKTVVPISSLTFTISPSKFRPDGRDFRKPMPGPYADRMRVVEEMSDDVSMTPPQTHPTFAVETRPPAPRKLMTDVPYPYPSTAVFGGPSSEFARALRDDSRKVPPRPGALPKAATISSLVTSSIPENFEFLDEELVDPPAHRAVFQLPVVHRGVDGAVLCTSETDPRDTKAVSEALEAQGATLFEMLGLPKSHSSSSCSSPFAHGSRTPDRMIDGMSEIDVLSFEELQEAQRLASSSGPGIKPPPPPTSSGFWGKFPWGS